MKRKKKRKKKVKFRGIDKEKKKRKKSKKRKFSSIDDGAMNDHHREARKRRRIMPEDRKRCSSLSSLRNLFITDAQNNTKKFEFPKITKMPPSRRKPNFAVRRARRSSLGFL